RLSLLAVRPSSLMSAGVLRVACREFIGGPVGTGLAAEPAERARPRRRAPQPLRTFGHGSLWKLGTRWPRALVGGAGGQTGPAGNAPGQPVRFQHRTVALGRTGLAKCGWPGVPAAAALVRCHPRRAALLDGQPVPGRDPAR